MPGPKVQSPETAQALSTARFERGIRVAASLQQANIVPGFAAGAVGGLPYSTMPSSRAKACCFVGRNWLTPSLFRLGELYENAGDAKTATEYYGRFVDLWVKADAELQPRVTEARNRIERLNKPRQ